MIAGLESKVVQELMEMLLEPIYVKLPSLSVKFELFIAISHILQS